ncbi:hypothetical protein B0T18DRAFT_409393 [Schizothecium vesticola]|uniref:Uncharacterized protein n=1 Tax=Schizothecium vesticola TaxID=314040 RepID=A0AA40F3R0_9PEZI|nr:hypothetical protein B0T18DRAFT_409393 [Schizothecium vesticola]
MIEERTLKGRIKALQSLASDKVYNAKVEAIPVDKISMPAHLALHIVHHFRCGNYFCAKAVLFLQGAP